MTRAAAFLILAMSVVVASDASAQLDGVVNPGYGGGVTQSSGDARYLRAADVRAYGAVCDGFTNDTVAVQAALTASTNVFIPSGTCTVTNVTITTDGTHIFGNGTDSILMMRDFATGCTIDAGSNAIDLESFRLYGHSTSSMKSTAASPNDRTGICMLSGARSSVRNMIIDGFEKYGIKFTDTSTNHSAHSIVSESSFYNDWTAIYMLPDFSEYIRIANLDMYANYIALDVRSGNIAMSDMKLADNGIGLNLIGTGISNNGHGYFSGIINHSGVYSVFCRDLSIGFSIEAEQINQGDIFLNNCTGVIINGGAIDVANIYANSGGANFIRGAFRYNGYPATITHNYDGGVDNTKVVDWTNAAGTSLEWSSVIANKDGGVALNGVVSAVGATTLNGGLQVNHGGKANLGITTATNDTLANWSGNTNSVQQYTTTAPMLVYGANIGMMGSSNDVNATTVAFAAVDNAGAGGIGATKLLSVYGAGMPSFPVVQTFSPSGATTLDPQAHQINASCSAGGGCTITMQETSAVAGMWFCLVNVGTNTLTFPDVAGVFDGPTLVGVTGLGAGDNFCAEYRSGQWYVTSATDN